MMISYTMIVDNIIHILFLLLQFKIMATREFSRETANNIIRFPLYPLYSLSYTSREFQPIKDQR